MHYYRHADPYFSDDQPLDEVTAQDLLHVIDPRDLPHRDYAPLVKYVKYVETRDNIMKFYVPSPTKINKWNFYVQFVQWHEQVADRSIDATEAARLLFWSGDLRVHCGCASFIYFGYEYILSALDAAIVPETRFPHIRNPQLKGILCKHGRRVMKTLGFHLGDMAQAIKQQRGQS
jgi:hypothetical protein